MAKDANSGDRGSAGMKITEMTARDADGTVRVVVEIPKGSRNKYEYDADLGVIALDRTLYSAVRFPTEYGFIPSTRGTDGDPLDAMVLMEEASFPGCLLRVRLIGVLTITHSTGSEYKLLSVPVGEPRFAEYNDVSDVPAHLLKEIEHFFEVYKDLEGSTIHSRGWQGASQAQAVLRDAEQGA